MFKQIAILTTLILSLNFSTAKANENITIIAPTSEVADGLDLYAVSELFKDTANLEEFEAELNNPEYGINNLDLDGDGYIDFIRVVEEVVDDTHIIILQALVWEDEIQDVATIEIETSGNTYDMHVHGNEVIYGSNYYIAPTHVHINTWPIIAWISRPVYRPYHSVYYWKSYPRWWKSHRPIHKNKYHIRTNKYKKHNSFVVTRNARVKHVTRVKYKPRKSVRVSNRVSHKTTELRSKRTVTNQNRSNSNSVRHNSNDARRNSNASRNQHNEVRNNSNVSRTTTRSKTVRKSDRNDNTAVRKEVSRTTTHNNGNNTHTKRSKTKTNTQVKKEKTKNKSKKSERDKN